MNGIYLLLGSNMGNRLEQLKAASTLLSERAITILDESSIYETAPWGKANQPWFLNVVLKVETLLSPEDLLKEVLDIEQEMGRVRVEKWGERCIDIDLLYYHNETIETDHLTIPHMGIPHRKFTLLPLAELCPLEIHPVLGQNQMEMLAACEDGLDCNLTDFRL